MSSLELLSFVYFQNFNLILLGTRNVLEPNWLFNKKRDMA